MQCKSTAGINSTCNSGAKAAAQISPPPLKPQATVCLTWCPGEQQDVWPTSMAVIIASRQRPFAFPISSLESCLQGPRLGLPFPSISPAFMIQLLLRGLRPLGRCCFHFLPFPSIFFSKWIKNVFFLLLLNRQRRPLQLWMLPFSLVLLTASREERSQLCLLNTAKKTLQHNFVHPCLFQIKIPARNFSAATILVTTYINTWVTIFSHPNSCLPLRPYWPF